MPYPRVTPFWQALSYALNMILSCFSRMITFFSRTANQPAHAYDVIADEAPDDQAIEGSGQVQFEEKGLQPDIAEKETKAALRIQRAVKAHQMRKHIGSYLNWFDLLFMHKKKLALRNQSVALGLKEIAEGGSGDGYALGAFAFNPARPILDDDSYPPLSAQAYALKQEEEAFRINALRLPANQLYPPLDPEFCNVKRRARSIFNDREAISKYPETRSGLTRKMNFYLFHLIHRCYTSYLKTNVFHLITLNNADRPNNMDKTNNGYPTGKCGTQLFEREQILATIQEGFYAQNTQIAVDYKVMTRVPFNGVRVSQTKLGFYSEESSGPHVFIKSQLGVDYLECEDLNTRRKRDLLMKVETWETHKAIIRTIKNLRRTQEQQESNGSDSTGLNALTSI